MANYHLTAREIMSVEIVTVLGDATVQEAAALMRLEGVRSLLVQPRHEGDPLAIVTYSDLVYQVLAEGLNPAATFIHQVMVKPALTLPPDMKVEYIARMFRNAGIGHAPVIDGSRLLGMVSMTDLITEVIDDPD